MKSKTKNAVLAIAGLVGGLIGAGEAVACLNTGGGSGCVSQYTWSLDQLTQSGTSYGNSYSGSSNVYNGTSVGMTVTAWADTNNGTIDTAAVTQSYDSLSNYLGMGVNNKVTDTNALEILSSGIRDALLFSFNKDITLNTLSAGWINSSPAEFSVYRYTGGAAGDSSLTGKTYGGLSSWALVNNYQFSAAKSPVDVNPGNLSSSKWLIAAYNSSSTGNKTDALKLICIGGDLPGGNGGGGKVSEPSGLLLLGTTVMGMLALRRRENNGVRA